MYNPLLNGFMQVGQIKQIIDLYKTGGNPSQLLQQMASNNPSMQPIVQALNNGQNPQQLFYDLCQKNGIDPSTILNQLK